MADIITAELVALDASFGQTKDGVIVGLTELVAAAGRATSPEGLARDVFAREAKSSTGMGGGLAIPHCRSEHVTEATLAFARLEEPVDFGAKDGPADLVFMIAAPASGDQEHLKLLTKLARALVRKDFTDALRSSTSRDEVVALVAGVVAPPEPVATAAVVAESTSTPTEEEAPSTSESAAGGPAPAAAFTSSP